MTNIGSVEGAFKKRSLQPRSIFQVTKILQQHRAIEIYLENKKSNGLSAKYNMKYSEKKNMEWEVNFVSHAKIKIC